MSGVTEALLQEALRRARAADQHAAALHDLGVGLVVVDGDLRVVHLDDAAEECVGGRVDQMHTDPPRVEVLREDGTPWPLADRPMQAAVLEGRITRSAVVGLRHSGTTRWLRVSARPLDPHDGPEPGVGRTALCTVTDITSDRQRQQALQESESRFRLLAEHATDVVARVDPSGACLYCSPSVREVYGWDPEDVVGQPLLAAVHPEDRAHVSRALERSTTTGEPQLLRHRGLHRSGRVLWVESACRTVRGPDGAVEVHTTTRDVTARVEAERRLARLALTDPLTGLANRAALVQQLEDLLAEGAPLALLFLDLDRFKVVNDSLGHSVGDELLRTLAARLAGLPPPALATRFGGDEFVVLAADLDEAGAHALADQVHRQLAEPVLLAGQRLVVGASIGLVLVAPGEDRPAEDLLRDADVAMYRAKARGRGSTAVWDPDLGTAARQRQQTEAELRAGLVAGEIVVHYQPQIDLATGRVVGVEALVRWQHPTRGLLAPGAFLDVADETGLVIDLGDRVLVEAGAQVARWREQPGCGDLALSVNVSAAELALPDRAASTGLALERAGLPPAALTVEVLESVLLDEEGTVEAGLLAYADLGVRLALDDFGTGSSSLLHLRRVAVDTVKVDRAFVAGLGSSRRDEAIVRALAALASDLGMRCVAEGVEQPRQRAWLAGHGVRWAQGYLLSRPLPAAQVTALLHDGPAPAAGGSARRR